MSTVMKRELKENVEMKEEREEERMKRKMDEASTRVTFIMTGQISKHEYPNVATNAQKKRAKGKKMK